MGTWWKISIWDDLSPQKIQEIKIHIESASQNFDESYSRFIKHSYILRTFSQAGSYTVPHDLFEMLELYKRFFSATNKRITPLIGQALIDAGYDADYSFSPHTISEVLDFDETLQLESPDKVFVKRPVIIDVGALGKGYFVEKIAQYLKVQQCYRYMVDGSGDIAFYSNDPDDYVTVGLEHPHDSAHVIGTIQLRSSFSICSSGSNRRSWEGYHHIIDPITKKSPESVVSTWVISNNAAVADGLATSLFLVPPQKLQEVFECEYAILSKDMILTRSDGFNAQLF